MAINHDQFVSWGLWANGNWGSGKLSCSWASWGLEIVLPAVAGAVNWLKSGYWWQQFYGWVANL